jgi:DNA-binding PadR family transcriptional regulator
MSPGKSPRARNAHRDERLLGGFEQAVLLALLRLGDGAYAVPLREELVAQIGRSVSRGAVYTALDRLEVRGLVRSRLGESAPSRGGRPKRYYTVTARGLQMLRASKGLLEHLWSGIDALERAR